MDAKTKCVNNVAYRGNDVRNQANLDVHAGIIPNGSIEIISTAGTVLLTVPPEKRAALADFIANATPN